MASCAFITTQNSSTRGRGSIYFKPLMDAHAKGSQVPRGGGGAVPSSSLPAASDAALPGPLPAGGGGGGVLGRSASPPTPEMGPALPATGRGPPLSARGGFAAWGGAISGLRPSDRREVISLGQLRMFTWALINGYGYRAGGRKGRVTERAGEAGGKRKMET